MITKRLSILMCLILLVQLCGCAVPEEYRYINPPVETEWKYQEPGTTKPPVVTEPEPEPEPPAAVKSAEEVASALSNKQLIAQLFLVKCPAKGASDLLQERDVGGIILCSDDLSGESPSSLREEIAEYQSLVPVKLIIAVDEEGGKFCPVSGKTAFRGKPFPTVRSAYFNNGTQEVRLQEGEKSRFLRDLGFNVNLGPICDLVTDDHAIMAERSMGLTATATADVVSAMVDVMHENGIGAVLKHFPGYGNSVVDAATGKIMNGNHEGTYQDNDFVPFRAGIKAGVGAVMVSHSLIPKLDPEMPASLSDTIIKTYLRGELGFDGVVICDDLTADVVTKYCNVNEAAIQAILNGSDMIVTEWSEEMYQALYRAVYEEYRISEERLMESVVRIIQWKMDMGLL